MKNNIFKNKFFVFLNILVIILDTITINFTKPNSAKAELSFDPGNIISDDIFTNKNTMTVAQIQAFMESKNSILKDYVIPEDYKIGPAENQPGAGKTASQLIYDESQEHSINPQVILATLAKEQGFFTGQDPDKFSLGPDYALKWALGYGVYYGSPSMDENNSLYSGGFGRQVAYAAWWFKKYYDNLVSGTYVEVASSTNNSRVCPYNENYRTCLWVGDLVTMRYHSSISNPPDYITFTIKSKASIVLYRYTPYVYNGNYNFWYYFNNFFVIYDSQIFSQNSYPTLTRSDVYKFEIKYTNTGSATWTKGLINLATDKSPDRISSFIREGSGDSGWVSPNRITMVENSVAPGETATFSFWMTVPNDRNPGTYREYFRLVAEGIQWFNDLGTYWDIKVVSDQEAYYPNQVSVQNNYPTLERGQAYNYVVKLTNSGYTTWNKNTVHLGTDGAQDRIPWMIREGDGDSGWVSPNRITMVENSVAPGETATFSFWMTVPLDAKSGTYKEYFKPVAENVTWMQDNGIYWQVTVK